MKQREGQKIEDLALEGLLYIEACEQLRLGNLYYKGKTKLQGQDTTARRINGWVRKEFIDRQGNMAATDLSDGLDNNALYGMLYKEAVELLRLGEFNVLGHESTYIALKDWVNKEYFKRTIGETNG
jgi:hypothetical protein